MSIYISIPTLEDTETLETILEAIATSDNPDQLTVGVACLSSKKYYAELKRGTEHLGNVHITRYNFSKNSGVGVGRKLAFSGYSDQDYVLQIDSHTHFTKSWDTKVLRMYEEAVALTGNRKTVLTAYLGAYTYTKDFGRTSLGTRPLFPNFVPGTLKETNTLPAWQSENLDVYQPHNFPKSSLIPAPKFNANFAFGNKEFAKSTGLYEKSVFFEEEILQTINLLGNGFDLVFPNQEVPLYHLYVENIGEEGKGKRQHLPSTDFDETADNYLRFVKDPKNKEACKAFQKYTGVHPIYGAVNSWRLPANFLSKLG